MHEKTADPSRDLPLFFRKSLYPAFPVTMRSNVS
jgi:hypothetical protein